MGRSVYVLPRARDKPISDQLRRLRDEFGHCSLKLDGPFADSYDSVAKIVEHVQRRMRSEGMDEVSATVLTLLPQNLVPGDSLLSGSSMLDVPFILDMQPGMVRGYPESAGEAALVPSIGFQGGLAREIDPSSITILAVSMLRRLGRECYFSIYNCESSATDETHDIDMNVPAILLPEDRGMNMASVVPMPIVSKTSYPPFLEVVDEDALLSVIKLNNAYQHAHALMADMAGHGIKSYGERTSRSVRIGHEAPRGNISLDRLRSEGGHRRRRGDVRAGQQALQHQGKRRAVHRAHHDHGSVTCHGCGFRHASEGDRGGNRDVRRVPKQEGGLLPVPG